MEQRKPLLIGECLEISEDEYEVHREWYRQGWIFKDEDAFLNHPDKPCYVPELSHSIYTGQEIRELCNNQENFARELFEALDWQHAQSCIDDWVANGEWCFCPGCGHLYDCEENEKCPECGEPYEKEWEDNEIMTEIDKLEAYLKEKGIRYIKEKRFCEEIRKLMEEAGEDPGEQITVYELGRKSWDVICGDGSYGFNAGLLEAMGRKVVRSPAGEKIEGWLTAQEIINRLEGKES